MAAASRGRDRRAQDIRVRPKANELESLLTQVLIQVAQVEAQLRHQSRSAEFSTACLQPACSASLRGHIMQSRSASTLVKLRDSDSALIKHLRQLNIQLIILLAATSQLAMSASVWGPVDSQTLAYHIINRPPGHAPTTTGGSGAPDVLMHVTPAWMSSLRRPLHNPSPPGPGSGPHGNRDRGWRSESQRDDLSRGSMIRRRRPSLRAAGAAAIAVVGRCGPPHRRFGRAPEEPDAGAAAVVIPKYGIRVVLAARTLPVKQIRCDGHAPPHRRLHVHQSHSGPCGPEIFDSIV